MRNESAPINFVINTSRKFAKINNVLKNDVHPKANVKYAKWNEGSSSECRDILIRILVLGVVTTQVA